MVGSFSDIWLLEVSSGVPDLSGVPGLRNLYQLGRQYDSAWLMPEETL